MFMGLRILFAFNYTSILLDKFTFFVSCFPSDAMTTLTTNKLIDIEINF